MPVPKTDETYGDEIGGTTDGAIVGFWFSNVDWAWVPLYLGEVREATGNPSLGVRDAWDWAAINVGPLRQSKPLGGGRDEAYAYDASGRRSAPSGGGGGGGGGAAAVYQAPDEGAVDDYVKSYVVAVTGTADKALIDKAKKAFLAADKKGFKQEGGTVEDPAQSMKEVVRGSAAYKTIHSLRPESVDEMDWVTSRQAKLRQLGVSDMRAEKLGVTQATVGSTDDALVDAAEMSTVQNTGMLLKSQRESLKASAAVVAGLVR